MKRFWKHRWWRPTYCATIWKGRCAPCTTRTTWGSACFTKRALSPVPVAVPALPAHCAARLELVAVAEDTLWAAGQVQGGDAMCDFEAGHRVGVRSAHRCGPPPPTPPMNGFTCLEMRTAPAGRKAACESAGAAAVGDMLGDGGVLQRWRRLSTMTLTAGWCFATASSLRAWPPTPSCASRTARSAAGILTSAWRCTCSASWPTRACSPRPACLWQAARAEMAPCAAAAHWLMANAAGAFFAGRTHRSTLGRACANRAVRRRRCVAGPIPGDGVAAGGCAQQRLRGRHDLLLWQEKRAADGAAGPLLPLARRGGHQHGSGCPAARTPPSPPSPAAGALGVTLRVYCSCRAPGFPAALRSSSAVPL